MRVRQVLSNVFSYAVILGLVTALGFAIWVGNSHPLWTVGAVGAAVVIKIVTEVL